MMKKRLLALALCLVMMTSLLPITAAAAEDCELLGVQVRSSGFQNTTNGYVLEGEQWKIEANPDPNKAEEFFVESWSSQALYQDEGLTTPVKDVLVDGRTYYLKCQLVFPRIGSFQNFLNENNCSLTIPSYSAKYYSSKAYMDKTQPRYIVDIIFQVAKNHEHQWKFTVSENHDTLTAQCQNQECRKEVSVTLKADSVTLPTSPFNARLEGKKEFEDATGAEIGEIVYKCNKEIVTDQSNPKAGQYQAWVMIKNLSGPVYQDGVAALAEDSNTKSSAELFVHYTAADPAVTAQTGDDRPIELMLVCALAFSALAAAAFILDNKRKYSR